MQRLTQEILILKGACPTTSYVAATFYPTIGQCAHQSLSNTATPKLDMIPTRNKGRLACSHIVKGISKFIQAKHSWVYQATREVEGWIAKLLISIIKLWTPAPDLAWLLNIYTPITRKHPLLYYTVPQAMPSIPVLFRVCKEENTTPMDMSVRFLSPLGLSS